MEIQRGLRQGSPLSPVLFNLMVEILSLAIKNNENIRGIEIENYGEKKHSQYADDLWAAITATQESFDALLNTFDQFVKISGLTINYEKTQILRVGSWQNTKSKLKNDRNIQWVNTTKILGIDVSANRVNMINENYEKLIEKMKERMNMWRSRTSTLIGKITIVNTLILSQTVYKILNLNTPPEKI